ncbi:MAG: hypothetical protein AAF580_13830 [Pseudomonadota bacterium]
MAIVDAGAIVTRPFATIDVRAQPKRASIRHIACAGTYIFRSQSLARARGKLLRPSQKKEPEDHPLSKICEARIRSRKSYSSTTHHGTPDWLRRRAGRNANVGIKNSLVISCLIQGADAIGVDPGSTGAFVMTDRK